MAGLVLVKKREVFFVYLLLDIFSSFPKAETIRPRAHDGWLYNLFVWAHKIYWKKGIEKYKTKNYFQTISSKGLRHIVAFKLDETTVFVANWLAFYLQD